MPEICTFAIHKYPITMAKVTSYFIWVRETNCGIDFTYEGEAEPVQWGGMTSGALADIISMMRLGEVHYNTAGYLYVKDTSSQPLIAEQFQPH